MLWGMALTYNDLPIATPNGQRLPIGESLVVVRERCRKLSEATEAVPVMVELTSPKSPLGDRTKWRRGAPVPRCNP